MTRPLIAVPARFSASASALRYAAEVNAAALVRAVWDAGGEPCTLHPHAPDGVADAGEVAERLGRFDGLLLPGGGDVAPWRYGSIEPPHERVYDVHEDQDGFDLAAARFALGAGLPLLAVCRGMQVVNVALGGTLRQDMGGAGYEHRHVVHTVAAAPGSLAAGLGSDALTVSCYHHQRVERLGTGLVATAWAADGTVEAVELPGGAGWFAGVQWHPEDTVGDDAAQRGLFAAFTNAARAFSNAARTPPSRSGV